MVLASHEIVFWAGILLWRSQVADLRMGQTVFMVPVVYCFLQLEVEIRNRHTVCSLLLENATH